MSELFATSSETKHRSVRLIRASHLEDDLSALGEGACDLLKRGGFSGRPGQIVSLPEGSGADAVVGVGLANDPQAFGPAALGLAEGTWRLEGPLHGLDPTLLAIAWAMGGYQFARYKTWPRKPAKLMPVDGADMAEAKRVAKSIHLVRDLVNTPAQDMGPHALQDAVTALAKEFGAKSKSTTGDKLLKDNYPMIHAVGRAAHEAPRLIELEWGDPSHPLVALVGKGITFDSGGLDIKGAAGMRLMKKDMGGAANAIGLARLIMDAKLPVHLKLYVAAAENAIGPGAFRPGDILPSRKGLTVEIDNTDAEGRLVLGDAIARAVEDEPDLLLDFATLTGAARVALGPDLAPFYSNDTDLAEAISRGGVKANDPVWQLPLWDNYDSWLDGNISDLKNAASGGFAGSITAALFLRRFVGKTRWAHFDIFAWNPEDRPARPKGGEMLGSRAAWAMLKEQYGKGK